MLRIVSWNINSREECWRSLVADGRFHVALLQEAVEPPPDVRARIRTDLETPWQTAGAGLRRPWRTAVVALSDEVELTPRPTRTIEQAEWKELAVSRAGTVAVADATLKRSGQTFTLASMYAAWESPSEGNWIYADASVHRVVSDLSMLVGRQRGHRIIAAGDLNIMYGYGETGSPYWKTRYDTVFERMRAIGVPFAGPQAPGGGRQADPWPTELPPESRNVPTFRNRVSEPGSAIRQLDYVFASERLLPAVRVKALNEDDEWGPSDHCRISIEVTSQ